ncbi:MAG TPA: hypothetical protein ENI08_00850 [Candidatus Dependentiae bacterium]|nr:hypothetical protein [Candidatus Dependentiae bacterium]
MLTDKERIDFLQKQLGMGKKVTCKQLTIYNRGWRLHETTRQDGETNVREAIDKYIEAVEEFAWEG